MRRVLNFDVLLTSACLATSTAALSGHKIFERASTCADPTSSQCSSNLPSDFCCPSGNSCVVLAANTTVLCCPAGNSCSVIKSISCDITQQNVTAHPGIALMTTDLTGILPKCASQCCPFGYSCNSNNDCVMNANQQTPPSSSSPSSASTSAPPALPTASSSSASSAPVASATALIGETCNKFPITAVLVGFFPGLVLGVLLTVASICLLGAHRRKASRRHSGSSFGNISDPQPQSDMRTDFLRKPPQTPSTDAGTTPSRQPNLQRVRSLFRKSAAANASPEHSPRSAPPIPSSLAIKKVQAHGRPVTPVLQREPSYEDINIFADGDTASALRERERQNGLAPEGNRASHQTTFTDMMEKSGLAGLQKGQRKFTS
jgi:hypothetical protein